MNLWCDLQAQYLPRKRKKCSFCDRVRLTTKCWWEVEVPVVGEDTTVMKSIEVWVCNDCLASSS